ncbi:putative histidine phosphatase superfamily, clade-2, histidine acid phosphatase active [Plasmopara halstedii]
MAPRPKSPASLSLINQADNLECANENDLTLYHVLVLFRHGDRSPISRNVSTKVKMTQIDTEFWASRLADLSVVDALNSGTQVVTFHNGRCSEESCYGQDFKMPPPPKQGGRWPCGQLTAKGIDMMKKKGECLRERYKNLLNHMEDPTQQVYVESTNIRRTIRSAQSLLAGLFPDYFTNVDAEKKLAIRKKSLLESQETQHSVLINGEMKKQEVFVIHADDSNSLVPHHSNELYTDLGKILDAEIKMHGPPGFHEALQKVSTIIGAGSDKLIGWTRLREALVCYKAHGLAFPNGLDQQLFMQICEYDAWLWHHFYGKMAMCRLSFKSGVQRLYLYLNDVISSNI